MTAFVAGSSTLGTQQYGDGGILYSTVCRTNCTGLEQHYSGLATVDQLGRLYGANIVDEWTEARGAGSADIYWLLSTWDPYQVVIVRTHIQP